MLNINFREQVLAKKYIADFVCYNKVIVELKATDNIAEHDVAQVLNYLKATKLKIALLINFGATKLQYKRLIL